mgnify:CR=1 FL=1
MKRIPAPDIVDVFVYVVVLNLAIEYVPTVISETFTLSLLTAVLLKAVLEVVVRIKNRAKGRFKAAETPLARLGAENVASDTVGSTQVRQSLAL